MLYQYYITSVYILPLFTHTWMSPYFWDTILFRHITN